MEITKKEFEKGLRGIAKVSMMESTKVRVTMQDTGEQFLITKEDLPPYFPYREGREIKCSLTLDGKTSKVVYANPATGDFKGTFRNFNKEDEIPAPLTRQGAKGAYPAFDAWFTITDGAWKGSAGVKFLNPSLFVKDADGNLGVNGYGKPLTDLTEFLESTGLAGVTIPYSENPLPELHKLALEIGKECTISFLNGKISSISEWFSLEEELAPAPAHELLDEG